MCIEKQASGCFSYLLRIVFLSFLNFFSETCNALRDLHRVYYELESLQGLRIYLGVHTN